MTFHSTSRFSLAVTIAGLMVMLWIVHGAQASILISAGYSPSAGETCFATPDEGTTVFSSTNASAVQQAVTAAHPGDTVKVAGHCASVQEVAHAWQTVHVPKSLTLRGGYTVTNWITALPLAQPTTLDAQGSGRVIYAITDITLSDLTLQNGNIGGASLCPSGCGGGIFAARSLNLRNVSILSSTATNEGGGAYAFGVAQVSGGLFQNNRCTSSACRGGGLFVYSTLLLTGTRFLSNTAGGTGGGGYVTSGLLEGTNRLVNGLFAGNTASEAAGLYLIDPTNGSGTAEVINTTIAHPTMGHGAGIAIGGGTVNITNTLIASYTIGISNTGGTVVEDYNLFFGNTITQVGAIIPGANSFIGDPGFAHASADDYHLTSASAAIDRGTDVSVSADLDGDPRPQGSGHDIGAYESSFWADLALIKSVTPSAAAPGKAITYTPTASTGGGPTAPDALRVITSAGLVVQPYAVYLPVILHE